MPSPRLYDRAVIRLSPQDSKEDVRGFLQGLVTQDTALIAPGEPSWSALLTPQGKVLFDFILFVDPAEPLDILVDCETAAAGALMRRLSLYRLRRKIDIALDDALGVYWSLSGNNSPDPRLPELGNRWIAAMHDGDEDAGPAYRNHRLSLGIAEGLAELGDGQILWLEANAIELNGVSFTKGCYVGQENTARMNWRGKVNRRMVVVPMAQEDQKRQLHSYPELGLSIEHRRVEDLTGLALPEWQRQAVMPKA